jgi:hypothetical protein
MLPADSLEADELRFHTTGWQHRRCTIPQAVTQSSAPEDGQNHRPKHVELIGIINKPLLLRLIGCPYYLSKVPIFFHSTNKNLRQELRFSHKYISQNC